MFDRFEDSTVVLAADAVVDGVEYCRNRRKGEENRWWGRTGGNRSILSPMRRRREGKTAVLIRTGIEPERHWA